MECVELEIKIAKNWMSNSNRKPDTIDLTQVGHTQCAPTAFLDNLKDVTND